MEHGLSFVYGGKDNVVYDTVIPHTLLMKRTNEVKTPYARYKVRGKALAKSLVSIILFRRIEKVNIPTFWVGMRVNDFSKYIRK